MDEDRLINVLERMADSLARIATVLERSGQGFSGVNKAENRSNYQGNRSRYGERQRFDDTEYWSNPKDGSGSQFRFVKEGSSCKKTEGTEVYEGPGSLVGLTLEEQSIAASVKAAISDSLAQLFSNTKPESRLQPKPSQKIEVTSGAVGAVQRFYGAPCSPSEPLPSSSLNQSFSSQKFLLGATTAEPPLAPAPLKKSQPLLPVVIPDKTNVGPDITSCPVIAEFLSQRGIVLNEIFQPFSPLVFDGALERLAWFMGENYSSISPLLTAIKSNLQRGSIFELDLGLLSEDSLSAVLSLGQGLLEWSLLEEFTYKGYPHYRLSARVNTIGIVHNYFSGFWFERYVAQAIEKVVKKVIKDKALPENSYSLVRNAKLLVDGNTPCERDMLLSFGQDVFWFECKSGEGFADSILPYESFARRFNFDLGCCFFVFLDTRDSCHRVSDVGMHVCSSFTFQSKLEEVLLEKLAQQR